MASANPSVTRYAGLAKVAGAKYHIDPAVILADINQESGGHEETSPTGARGISQFEPGTAKEYGVRYGSGPAEVRSQVEGQAKYLAALGGSKNIKAALEGYYTGKVGSGAGAGYANSVLAQVGAYRGAAGGGGGTPEGGSVGGQQAPSAAQSSDLQSLLSQLGSSASTPAPLGAAPHPAAYAGPTLSGSTPAPIEDAPSASSSPSDLLSLVKKIGEDGSKGSSSGVAALGSSAPPVAGKTPNAKGGVGFTPAPGTNYEKGSEGAIAERANKLATALGLKLTGISGYRSPAHSVAVGGFADDPHTEGKASDTPGIENVPESVLNKYGLERPFSKIVNGKQTNPAEADHIQLLGSHKG